MNPIVKTRSSVDHKTTYQISYNEIKKGRKAVYKLRRGEYGSWTKEREVNGIERLLFQLGFTTRKPDLLNDFMVEVYFTRGEIKLTAEMVAGLLISEDELSKHFYAKINKKDESYWILPANAVKTDDQYNWLKKFFMKFG